VETEQADGDQLPIALLNSHGQAKSTKGIKWREPMRQGSKCPDCAYQRR